MGRDKSAEVPNPDRVEFSVATREALTRNLVNTRSAITEIRQNLETIEAGRRRAETKIKELRVELELEQKERRQAQTDRAALAAKIEQLHARLQQGNDNEEELVKARQRLAEVARQKEDLDRSVTASRMEMAALNDRLKQALRRAEEFGHRIVELEGDLREARAGSQASVEAARELEAERAKTAVLLRQVEQRTAEAAKDKEECDKATAAYEHLAEEIRLERRDKSEGERKKQADLEMARAELEDAEKKIVELQAQLEAVNQSREVANLDLMIAKKAIEELRATAEDRYDRPQGPVGANRPGAGTGMAMRGHD